MSPMCLRPGGDACVLGVVERAGNALYLACGVPLPQFGVSWSARGDERWRVALGFSMANAAFRGDTV